MDELASRVAEADWYHTMELPGGIVTPGQFDTRAELRRIPMPARLDGMRCLDVGSCDGFWAFEMERRGAQEVIGVDLGSAHDIDWPGNAPDGAAAAAEGGPQARRAAFELAREALGSTVERRDLSVHDLDPGDIGTFDFVFIGSLLLHLRDPVGALESVRSVLRGEVLSVDAVSLILTLLHPRQPMARLEAPGWALWWVVNLAGYRRLFEAAGLTPVARGRPFMLRPGPSFTEMPRASGRGRAGRLAERVSHRRGVPHAWILAR